MLILRELKSFIQRYDDNTSFSRDDEYAIIADFSAMLGYRKHQVGSMRPNADPKYDNFRWFYKDSQGSRALRDVRSVSFNMLYVETFMELSANHNLKFPNNWNVYTVVDTLKKLRKHYKMKYIESDFDAKIYQNRQTVVKILLNGMYLIVCRHGVGDINDYHIVERAREIVTTAVKRISETALVVYVNTDTIYYIGDHVDIHGNVHHEKFNFGLTSNNYGSFVVGNDMRFECTSFVNHNEQSLERKKRELSEDKFIEFLGRYQRSFARFSEKYKESLDAYINRTLEDVFKEFPYKEE